MRVIPGSTHAAALLAATTILGISLGPQGCWFWSGDAGEMVMRQQLKLVGLAALLGITVDPAIAQEKLKIGVAVTKVKGLLERDHVDFVVWTIFSTVLQAIHKPVTDNKTFLISPNAGPSSYADKNSNPFF